MTLSADLAAEAKAILSGKWTEQTTTGVPAPADLLLNSNHAKQLESATVLYADLDGSTQMVDGYKWWFAADIYKIYLRSAARIIREEGGTITAYDGDRVMAVFVGDYKNTSAVKAALKINWAVEEILRPLIKNTYPNDNFLLKHVIGIDTSSLYAARVGVKGDNDIVWIGRAANYAAKLCTRSEAPLWITKAVHSKIRDDVKFSNGVAMWSPSPWASMNNMETFCSTYRWSLS